MVTFRTSDAPGRGATAAQGAVAALAVLSLAAGFLHAAVIDSHRGHGIAALVFAGLAVFQIVWAGSVLAHSSRWVLAIGAVGNAAIVGGYVASRTSGIPFVDGFKDAEPLALTDGVTTGLEVAIAVGATLLVLAPARRLWPAGRLGTGALGAVGLVVALVGVPAAAGAGSVHDHGQGTDHATGAGPAHAEGDHHDDGDHGDEAAAAVHHHGDEEPGADESVTPEQRAAADALLADTIEGLWQWTDEARVHAAGFRSIGDGVTGTEHLVNWGWINDDAVLDPDKPESLVYRVTPQGRVLEAAMYMAPAGTPDDEVPDVGGTLTQWHVHDNLCYSPARMVDGFPQRNVIGLTGADGTCSTGELLTPHAPMLHVWVVEKPCGPFSSLEGVGAGQAITEAQDPDAEPECDHSEH